MVWCFFYRVHVAESSAGIGHRTTNISFANAIVVLVIGFVRMRVSSSDYIGKYGCVGCTVDGCIGHGWQEQCRSLGGHIDNSPPFKQNHLTVKEVKVRNYCVRLKVNLGGCFFYTHKQVVSSLFGWMKIIN